MNPLLMKSKTPVNSQSLHTLCTIDSQLLNASNLLSINNKKFIAPQPSSCTPSRPSSIRISPVIPTLNKPIQKGEKALLFKRNEQLCLSAYLGWQVLNTACDIDVSAFLLDDSEKVIGEDWFVFYGQPNSPDRSTHFSPDGKDCRQMITIDFKKLDSRVKKIVFVLTINEAFEKKLNFSMVQDGYIKLVDSNTQKELGSFLMTDYYDNVISTMIGEIYLYKENWKFNAIGNGVSRDLAGLCNLYGVQVND